MAIYHFSAKIIGRSAGRSATAAAAYRAAEKIKDERQNMTFNYQARTQSVDHSEIIAPENAPDFCKNRSQLWNAVEASEKRKDAQTAREVEVALPKELTKEQNIALAREFAKHAFVARGMVADVCLHDMSKENPHAHIMLTTRHLTANSFGKKNREWNKDDLLEGWRKEWEQVCNQHLEKHGKKERIDHRTLKDQGIDRTPQKHLGVQAHSIEQRTGKPSNNRIKDLMRDIAQSNINDIRERLKQKQLEQAKQLELQRRAQEQRKRSRGFGMER